MKRNYLFRMRMAEQDLAEEKNPPLCDGCNDPFEVKEGICEVQALVLDGYIYGLECERCRVSYFSKMPILAGEDIPKDALRALHDVLGRNMTVTAW